MIDERTLQAALADHLPRQRWFAGDQDSAGAHSVVSMTVLKSGWPALVHVVVEAAGRRWQLAIGLRAIDAHDSFLDGKGDAVLGLVETTQGPAMAYDAVIDSELAPLLLAQAMPGAAVDRSRPMGADQSNTSVVFDERLILKLFRRLEDGPNPDVETTRGLLGVGFDHVAPLLAEWRDGAVHLAVVNEFLVGAVDGFQLALTSLRDLYDARVKPNEAGGDFGPEARRLGGVTARMHLAMSTAFATTPADPSAWADDMLEHLARVPSDRLDVSAVCAVYDRLRGVRPGPAIRVHGDYHLGQVVRTDAGWYVLDFEGEPARPLAERTRPSSPLRDVAGMLRSLHYASEVAIRDFGYADDPEAHELASDWERRNALSFLKGYNETEGIAVLLPPVETDHATTLLAFLLDKAVYEVGYEASHRPDWVGIPQSAVRRILEEAALT